MTNYARGKYARAMCPVCGMEVAYRKLKRRWDGLWVCNSLGCFDKKHEQITPPKHIQDPQALEHPWSDTDDEDPSDYLDTQLKDVIDMTFGDT